VFAFSFGIIPLSVTASIGLASIRLDPTRVSRGAELVVFALPVLLPVIGIIGGHLCTYGLFLLLPNSASIPANLLVLGVALALTTVRRRPNCSRSGGVEVGVIQP
jgi:hypothetical protein